MRYCSESFLRYQLAANAVDAVGLVLDADESPLQTLNKLLLAVGELYQLLLALRGAALLQYLVGRRRVVTVITISIHQLPHHLVVVSTGKAQFLVDNLLELLEFSI